MPSMAVVPPRKPTVRRLWSEVVNEAVTKQPGGAKPLDRNVDSYEFSQGVKKKAGNGPYTSGNPNRN